MIRDLQAEDKEQYLALIKMFVEERMGEFGIKFDEDHASQQFDLFSNMKEVICKVLVEDGEVVGTIAGVIGPMLFCKGSMVQEMVWYVKKQYRGLLSGIRLIRAFEQSAKERGCNAIMMVGMAGDPSNAWYLKDSYKALQNVYYKEIL